MKIDGTHTIKAPREKVWSLLTDPVVLARCIPGCQRLEAVGEDDYTATLNVGIGAIKGTYTGSVKLEEKTPFSHYKMVVSGKGPQGFVKGEGGLDLSEQGGETQVHYQGDVQIGGTLASVGQRMVQGSARMMAGQFFTAIAAEAAALLEAEKKTQPVVIPKQGVLRNLLRYVWGRLRDLLSRRRS